MFSSCLETAQQPKLYQLHRLEHTPKKLPYNFNSSRSTYMKSPANNVTCQKWPYFKSISKVFKHHALKLFAFRFTVLFPLVVASSSSFGSVGDISKSTRCRRLGGNSLRVASCQSKLKKLRPKGIYEYWVLVNLMSSLLPPQHPWHPNLIGWISGVNLEASPKLVSPLHIHIQRNTFQYIIIKHHLPHLPKH